MKSIRKVKTHYRFRTLFPQSRSTHWHSDITMKPGTFAAVSMSYVKKVDNSIQRPPAIFHKQSRTSLRWRHNGLDSVSNHQPPGCLLNRLFRRKSKKTSKLRVTGLCAGNSPGTGEFSAQMASYAENVSIWWRHHDEQNSLKKMWSKLNTVRLGPSICTSYYIPSPHLTSHHITPSSIHVYLTISWHIAQCNELSYFKLCICIYLCCIDPG